ncbi:MAG: glutamyl-tRNA reductase [Planctomycetota bacterium]
MTLAVSTGGVNCRKSKFVRQELGRHARKITEREIVVFGTSFQELGIDGFEEVKKRLNDNFQLLENIRGIYEFALLNTCNRVELLLVADAGESIFGLVRKIMGFDTLAEGDYYFHEGFAAFEHSCKVISGIHSQVTGEYHIVSQFKECVNAAVEKSYADNIMKSWLDSILNISKKIRNGFPEIIKVEEIEEQSIIYAEENLADIKNAAAVVIGTGSIGRFVIDKLADKVKEISWVYHKNKPELEKYRNIDTCQIENMTELFKEADLIISAVSAEKPVITESHKTFFADNRKTIVIDLGMPKNVSAEIASANIDLKTMTDLKSKITRSPEVTEEVVNWAESIIEENKDIYDKFADNIKCRNTGQ